MSRARDLADSNPSLISDQANNSTGFFDISAGTTAQRPGSPASGNIRFNSTLGVVEFYDGSAWQIVADYLGTTYPIMYTLVGGGGGGGFGGGVGCGAGGGGAGGMREGIFFVTVGQTYNIDIGSGGAGRSSDNSNYASSGDVSKIRGTFADRGIQEIVVLGGGNGSNHNTNQNSANGVGSQTVACGGGGGSTSGVNDYNVVYGFIGGAGSAFGGGGGNGGSYNNGAYASGGGGGGTNSGGASFRTGNTPVGAASYGGQSRASICNGVQYGGGGGGGYSNGRSSMGNGGGYTPHGGSYTQLGGQGGAGGGSGVNTANGVANTGSGGGGGGGSTAGDGNKNGGNGSDGVCVLRMPTNRYSSNTTGSPSSSTSGTDTILLYTSSGTYVA